MKRNDLVDIEYYFSQKLAGSLSDKDLIYINTLIEHDAEINQRWQDFCADFNESDISNQFSRLDDPHGWKPITTAQLGTKTMKGRFLSVLVNKKYVPVYAAAILIALFLLRDQGSLFIPRKIQPLNNELTQQDTFVLTLADGRVVDLSKPDGENRQGIHYNSHEKLLSFDPGGAPTGNNTLKVPAGKSISLLLSDGSKMMVNSATEIIFPIIFDERKREVSINGEAYLTVAKDPSRPFTVHTRSGEVQVLGTEFNLNSYDPAKMTVTLIQGSVKVVTSKGQVTLKPGTRAIAGKQNKIIVEQNMDSQALSWKKGVYYFHNSDLKEIKEILERWYNIEIYIDNPSLSNQRFTGAIDKTSNVSIFLENLTAVTTIRYSIDSARNVHFN
ncbi:FecR domain-containing protein [Chitinophaga sp. OAE865]|uniref:FecR family protein n=1 Tax=Chitinophaga sp. OAE865 TaxID=2817898 RepID=UPI001AEB8666